MLQNSNKLSPSREAVSCAATQELPSILWNPNVRYRIHKSPPLVTILLQITPVHIIQTSFSEVYFKIIFRSTPAFLFVSFFLAFLPIT
jgi:hypothetical protein